jgi:hypothetical protein
MAHEELVWQAFGVQIKLDQKKSGLLKSENF